MSAKQHEADDAQALPSLPGAVTVADMYLERMTKRMEEMTERLGKMTSFLEKVGLLLENQANAPIMAPATLEANIEGLDGVNERLDRLIAILERNQPPAPPAGQTELKENRRKHRS